MKKVTVGLVVHRIKYLEKSIPSLLAQDYPNIEYIIRDNEEGVHSSYDFIKKNFPDLFPKIIFQKGTNNMHSGGHNSIIQKMTGEIYFCTSNDIVYPPNMVTEFVKAFEKNPDYTFATCISHRWDYENDKHTNIIDSYGIGIKKYHHYFDIGQGEEDNGQYKNIFELFGSSGSLIAFKKSALDSIKYKDEYFDELLQNKNDVDLSYRLQWAGNRCMLLTNIIVYHDRQDSRQKDKSFAVKNYSLKGDFAVLTKNFSKRYPLSIKIQTAIYKYLKLCYLFISTPGLIKEYLKIRKLKNKFLEKRKSAKFIKPESEIIKLMS